MRIKQKFYETFIDKLDHLIERTGVEIREYIGASANKEALEKLICHKKQSTAAALREFGAPAKGTGAALRELGVPTKNIYTEVQEWCTRVKIDYFKLSNSITFSYHEWAEKSINKTAEPAEIKNKTLGKPRKFKPNTSTFCYNDWTHARTLRSAGSKRPNEGDCVEC